MKNKKQTIYIPVGFPACGKTTYWKKRLPSCKRISCDDLIGMVLANGWTAKDAPTIQVIEEQCIKALLKDGHDIYIDRTNLSKAERNRWLELAAEVEFEHWEQTLKLTKIETICLHFKTNIKTCKKRNALREHPVPDEAYEKMNKRYKKPTRSEGLNIITIIK